MPTARKLFPSYGSAVAQALCHALQRDGMVRNFVAGYAKEFDRSAIAASAAQARDLEITIGREALLAMTIELREQLPRFFGKRRGAVEALAETQSSAADAFFQQYFSALGRVEDWTNEEMAEFLRDLELYARMGPQHAPPQRAQVQKDAKAKAPRARGSESARKPASTSAQAPVDRFPFPDRCALLLDPSMMEKARRAADRFHGELIRAAGKLLARTLGMRTAR
jgi:hypothetical protein